MRAAFISLVVVFIAMAATAHAQDRERARELFERASEAREAGRWQEVRTLLEEALELYPRFSTAWNLVTAIERTGDLPAAERLLERVRDGETGALSADERRSVAARLDEIASRLATLIVVAEGARDGVELDGTTRVALDAAGSARIRVNPGTHDLAIVSGDGRRVERTVDASAGAVVRVRLATPEEERVERTLSPRRPTRAGAGESSVWESPWLWVGIGAAVIAGAAVTVLVLTGEQTADPVAADFTATGL